MMKREKKVEQPEERNPELKKKESAKKLLSKIVYQDDIIGTILESDFNQDETSKRGSGESDTEFDPDASLDSMVKSSSPQNQKESSKQEKPDDDGFLAPFPLKKSSKKEAPSSQNSQQTDGKDAKKYTPPDWIPNPMDLSIRD